MHFWRPRVCHFPAGRRVGTISWPVLDPGADRIGLLCRKEEPGRNRLPAHYPQKFTIDVNFSSLRESGPEIESDWGYTVIGSPFTTKRRSLAHAGFT